MGKGDKTLIITPLDTYYKRKNPDFTGFICKDVNKMGRLLSI